MAAAPPSMAPSACCPETMLAASQPVDTPATSAAISPIAEIVREGLSRFPKQLPPWLFYDEAGSLLFEQITCLPEYYLTRLEREIFRRHADEMITAAADGHRLRLVELGAGSADKTRTLLTSALTYQGAVGYLPVDVSETALEMACRRIETELPDVTTTPVVGDYTINWSVPDGDDDERQLLLWIGSSIGNFEPEAAIALLRRIHGTMRPGDGLLLGVDLAPTESTSTDNAELAPGCKCVPELIAAYDDAEGVTAAFNRNLLMHLNRELHAEFNPDEFVHRAVWNRAASRMEMHLESREEQAIWIAALETEVQFSAGERLHTENSYKYTAEQAAGLMALAGFPVERHWLAGVEGSPVHDPSSAWFAVMLGRKG